MAIDDSLFKNLLKQERKPPPSKYKAYDSPENIIRDKTESIKRQNKDISTVKSESKKRQFEDNLNVTKINRDKIESRIETAIETKQRQNRANLETNFSFELIVRNERKILLFVYELCKSELNQATPSLTIEHIAEACKINKTSIKKSIQRLEKKGMIIRHKYKKGPGGWTQYALPKTLYNTILYYENNNKLETIKRQNGDKLESSMETSIETNLSSSSSLNNIKTTTTDEPNLLPAEWNNLDMSEIYGFTKQKLLSVYPYIVQCGFSVFDIQQAIDAIVYDDKQGHKKIDNRCGLLISGIRKGDLYTSDFYNKHLLEKAEAAKRKNQALLDAKIELWIQEVGKPYVESQLPSHLAIDFKVGGKDAKRAVEQLYFKSQADRPHRE